MTKYSPLTDREEVTQLRDECMQAIADGYEYVWDIEDKGKAQSITKHVNALALTAFAMRRKRGNAYISTPMQTVDGVTLSQEEWLALFDLDQMFEMMPSVRCSLREANPMYKGTPLQDIADYASRLLELLPAE